MIYVIRVILEALEDHLMLGSNVSLSHICICCGKQENFPHFNLKVWFVYLIVYPQCNSLFFLLKLAKEELTNRCW